jgi:hypothetical protein
MDAAKFREIKAKLVLRYGQAAFDRLILLVAFPL